MTPREVVRAWSRLRPRGPHAGRGPAPGTARPRCPGSSRAPPGPAPAPEVSGELQSPVMTTPSARAAAAAAAAAASSAAPASQAPGGTRPAVRGIFTRPPPSASPGRAVGASACSRRGFPAGWRFSTGPPAPSIARGPRRRTWGSRPDPPVTEGSAPLRRLPRRAGPRARWARRSMPGFPGRDVASFQAPPRRVEVCVGRVQCAVLGGGWSPGITAPRTPARYHGCRRALAADPAALASQTLQRTADGPHLAISGPF